MIYKRCPHCGRRIPSGTTCPCYKRQYAPTKEGAEFYHTQRWQKLRAYIIAKFDGLDLWAQSKGRIEYASTVHHIIPADEDRTQLFTEANLIPVSRASHAEIHKLYESNEAEKKHTQDLLRGLVHSRGGGLRNLLD